jgi:hypothetical protein
MKEPVLHLTMAKRSSSLADQLPGADDVSLVRVLHIEDDLFQQMSMQCVLESIQARNSQWTIEHLKAATGTEALEATTPPAAMRQGAGGAASAAVLLAIAAKMLLMDPAARPAGG